MPNCYHVIRSAPAATIDDVKDCVRDVGAPGVLKRVAWDGARVHTWVHYESRDDADRCLHPITRCLRDKGHTVYRADVLENIEGHAGLDD